MPGAPGVLDPVGVGATRFRQNVCTLILDLRLTVIRGNASEILALVGIAARGCGADSSDTVEAAEAAARELAGRRGAVVAVFGPLDDVTDRARAFHVANGFALMSRITALGCSLSRVVVAFVVGQPALPATLAAMAYYGQIGERASGATYCRPRRNPERVSGCALYPFAG